MHEKTLFYRRVRAGREVIPARGPYAGFRRVARENARTTTIFISFLNFPRWALFSVLNPTPHKASEGNSNVLTAARTSLSKELVISFTKRNTRFDLKNIHKFLRRFRLLLNNSLRTVSQMV